MEKIPVLKPLWVRYPFLLNNDGIARQPWDRCSFCLERDWVPYVHERAFLGYHVWVRCRRCGNIGASVPLLQKDPREPINGHCIIRLDGALLLT